MSFRSPEVSHLESKVFLSCPTIRLDNGNAEQMLHKVREYMSLHMTDIVDNSNIDKSCLGKAGLHLNPKGSGRLAINFISLMRSL